MSYNPPPKGRFEYYSPDGKYLGEWGSGPFAGFRALLDSEYDTVLANQKRIDAMRDDWDPGMGPENRDPFVQPDPGWTKPLIGPIGWAMFDASKPIQVQVDQKVFLEGLFTDAKNAHGAEKGAYMVYSFKLLTLSLVRAVNKAPAANQKTEFVWDLGKDNLGRRTLPTDSTKVVIGTIHTHWDDNGREKPELSRDKDVPSARDNKFVVYALDRKYLHRADPDGVPHDRLARNITDVLSSALRIYGKTF